MANPLDALISRLGKVRVSHPRVHSGVLFDAARGIGGVPDAANVGYRGYMAYMTPRQFLQLNPPRDLSVRPIGHIRQAIDAGEPIGVPMLYVDRRPNATSMDVPIEDWVVRGHEGRGRMMALQERSPNSLFPVAVHPYGWVRARNLAGDDSLRWIRPDDGGHSVSRPDISILAGKAHIQPETARFWAEHYDPAYHQNVDGLVRALKELSDQP